MTARQSGRSPGHSSPSQLGAGLCGHLAGTAGTAGMIGAAGTTGAAGMTGVAGMTEAFGAAWTTGTTGAAGTVAAPPTSIWRRGRDSGVFCMINFFRLLKGQHVHVYRKFQLLFSSSATISPAREAVNARCVYCTFPTRYKQSTPRMVKISIPADFRKKQQRFYCCEYRL